MLIFLKYYMGLSLPGPESICESYGRPLVALTVADIGLDDDTIEEKLVKWFSLAERWRGVLLLDEADIFMEKRTRTDVKRNALVSGRRIAC